MLIVMNASAGKAEIDNVVRVVESLGFRAHVMPGANRTAIGVTGNQGAVDLSHFEHLPGVSEAIRVTKPYKLITLDLRPDRTIVDLGDGARIGDGSLAIIAGPCAVENSKQAFAIADVVQRSGAKFFRGGAFKPRTSPYAFSGLGEAALKILADIRQEFGLKIVSEALDEANVDLVEKYADMIQIGARNRSQLHGHAASARRCRGWRGWSNDRSARPARRSALRRRAIANVRRIRTNGARSSPNTRRYLAQWRLNSQKIREQLTSFGRQDRFWVELHAV